MRYTRRLSPFHSHTRDSVHTLAAAGGTTIGLIYDGYFTPSLFLCGIGNHACRVTDKCSNAVGQMRQILKNSSTNMVKPFQIFQAGSILAFGPYHGETFRQLLHLLLLMSG
jgi:hypothetical protein